MSIVRPLARSVEQKQITVDLFTGSYRFSAKIVVPQYSMVTILNDRSSNYLNLVDVYISRINAPGDIIATYQRGAILKDEVSFILLPNEMDGASSDNQDPNTQINIPLFITLPLFEVEGNLQWRRDRDVKNILNVDSHRFFSVTQATIRNAFVPKIVFEATNVLINKSKLSILCFDGAN